MRGKWEKWWEIDAGDHRVKKMGVVLAGEVPSFFVFLVNEFIEEFDVLKLAVVSAPQNATHTNGVLIHQVNCLSGVHHKAVLTQLHVSYFHLKVPGKLLPTHL